MVATASSTFLLALPRRLREYRRTQAAQAANLKTRTQQQQASGLTAPGEEPKSAPRTATHGRCCRESPVEGATHGRTVPLMGKHQRSSSPSREPRAEQGYSAPRITNEGGSELECAGDSPGVGPIMGNSTAAGAAPEQRRRCRPGGRSPSPTSSLARRSTVSGATPTQTGGTIGARSGAKA